MIPAVRIRHMCKKLEASMEMVKVDFGDATCVVANFVPTEYSLI